MLVTFKSKSSADIMMFGDVAHQMLRMMGYPEQVPGAIEPEDIPTALSKLTLATEKIHLDEQAFEHMVSEELDEVNELDIEPAVSLHTRAIPLIAMLKAAQAADEYVMWE